MKTMPRQKTCIIPGCHRLPAAKGKCTHHLGLTTTPTTDQKGRHVPRVFELLDSLPSSQRQLKTLTGDFKLLADKLCDNPGMYIRVPHDLIADKFGFLTDTEKRKALQRLYNQVRTGAAWRHPDGKFDAALRIGDNYGIYVTFIPNGGDK